MQRTEIIRQIRSAMDAGNAFLYVMSTTAGFSRKDVLTINPEDFEQILLRIS